VPLLKPPHPDERLERFDRGIGVLSRDGRFEGHVATTLGRFWSPSSPLRWQPWVWYIVIWADGSREPSAEDYPPFATVDEIGSGRLEVVSSAAGRSGWYDFSWILGAEAETALNRLGITPEDF